MYIVTINPGGGDTVEIIIRDAENEMDAQAKALRSIQRLVVVVDCRYVEDVPDG